MSARARAVRVIDGDNTPPCPQAEATLVLAAEVRKLRLTVRAGIRQVQPACTAVKGLCAWTRRWGPWALGSIPLVLTSVGAISPQAAKGLAALLKAFGS